MKNAIIKEIEERASILEDDIDSVEYIDGVRFEYTEEYIHEKAIEKAVEEMLDSVSNCSYVYYKIEKYLNELYGTELSENNPYK